MGVVRLLLMALQRGKDGGGVTLEDLGVNSFIHDYRPTPSGGTIQGLVDGWGNPIVFCRWPVYSTVLNPNGQPLARRQQRPRRSQRTSGIGDVAAKHADGYGLFQQYCHPVPAHTAAEPTTYRIFPLIASAGPDGVLGLDKEPLRFPWRTRRAQSTPP